MERFALKMGTGRAMWWPFQLHDGRRSAVVRCPECGLPSFVTDHKIDDRGDMQGAFRCRAASCGFHGDLALDGWQEDEQHAAHP